METHRIHPELLERQVRVLVVGCGGTGSAVVAGCLTSTIMWNSRSSIIYDLA